MVGKWTITFSFSYAIVTFSPLLFLWIAHISTTQEIDSSFLGGFITASGILTGFLTSSAISRRETLDIHNYLMLLLNVGAFFLVLNIIFLKHLIFIGRPDLLDFGFVMVSVNANAFTAIIIAMRLLVHEFIERIQQSIKEAFHSSKYSRS
jgi:hypothetical protein